MEAKERQSKCLLQLWLRRRNLENLSRGGENRQEKSPAADDTQLNRVWSATSNSKNVAWKSATDDAGNVNAVNDAPHAARDDASAYATGDDAPRDAGNATWNAAYDPGHARHATRNATVWSSTTNVIWTSVSEN